MSDNNDEPKLYIMPGAFDNFEGTQEELDKLMSEINELVETGDIFDMSETVSLAELYDQEPSLATSIALQLGILDDMLDQDGNFIDPSLLNDVTDEDLAQGFTNMVAKNKKKLN